VGISDTSPEARTVQFHILRSKSGEERVLLALEMSLFARELARARIRRENPTWTDAEIARELLRVAFLPAPLPAGLP
jgi:hypothetical protein